MVKRCSWGTCKTDSRFPERLKGGVTFIPFPKPARSLDKCREWIRLCGRPQTQLNEEILRDRGKSKHIFVCSKHFVEGLPSKRFPNPRSALLYDTSLSSQGPTPGVDKVNNAGSRQKLLDIVESTKNDDSENIHMYMTPSGVQSDFQDNGSLKDVAPTDIVALVAENKRLVEERNRLSDGYSTLLCKYEDLRRKTGSTESTTESKSRDSQAIFSCSNLSAANYHYYTGFSCDKFNDLLKVLVPSDSEEILTWTKIVSGNGIKHVSLEDQLLLVLMKLRLNFDFVHLSHLFGISSEACSGLFSNWINYMYDVFKTCSTSSSDTHESPLFRLSQMIEG
ncbi:uncharacterized protein [Argopecten irradians]|uniref:uncharacterized protein isoform X2 n=1 Tax=Argopecten irradians TaxID=31199 RepID=UPI0037180D10